MLVDVEYFDWMDNLETPKYLYENEWLERREKFADDVRMINMQLDRIEEMAKDMREVGSFQRYYHMEVSERDKEIEKMKNEVEKQLNLIINITPYLSVKYRAIFMVKKLKW